MRSHPTVAKLNQLLAWITVGPHFTEDTFGPHELRIHIARNTHSNPQEMEEPFVPNLLLEVFDEECLLPSGVHIALGRRDHRSLFRMQDHILDLVDDITRRVVFNGVPPMDTFGFKVEQIA